MAEGGGNKKSCGEPGVWGCDNNELSMTVASEEVDNGDGEYTEPVVDVVTSALGGVHLRAGWGAGGLMEEIDFLLPSGLGAWVDEEGSWKDFLSEELASRDLSPFFARFAQRNPQALQRVFGPLGPLRHSGESVRPHVKHTN